MRGESGWSLEGNRVPGAFGTTQGASAAVEGAERAWGGFPSPLKFLCRGGEVALSFWGTFPPQPPGGRELVH